MIAPKHQLPCQRCGAADHTAAYHGRDLGACRSLVDDASRTLAQADVLLGAPDADLHHVERLLLDALNLTLRALGLLRGRPT